ncbi:MAG TPA: M24 family metallopeptidase [Steroidobacteraceae bacterium]|nr:M24 family metallopeptidase [Steroidobacteraceae bacterium]
MTVEQALADAQRKAEDLFAAIVAAGLIKAGLLESELSEQIHELARARFGVRRHWHKRVVRCGPNTVLTYYDEPADRRIAADDLVYLDFGPLFEEWEADFGRTYVLGTDPVKHRLVADIEAAFARGKQRFRDDPRLTAGALYDFVAELARQAGWEFGNTSAGHLIGHFPHETAPANSHRFSIRHGNDLDLREPDASGERRHWILEIHFVDRARMIGGFFEELLTI